MGSDRSVRLSLRTALAALALGATAIVTGALTGDASLALAGALLSLVSATENTE